MIYSSTADVAIASLSSCVAVLQKQLKKAQERVDDLQAELKAKGSDKNALAETE